LKSKIMGNLSSFVDVFVGGIDFDLPGNGGPQCAAYLTPQRQVLEFICGTILALTCLLLGINIHRNPNPDRYVRSKSTHLVKIFADGLLISLALTYLLEIGYKFYTHQAIFIFNPCHCLCLVEMFILYQLSKAIQGKEELTNKLLYTFRIHLYCLHAPLMAVVFPVTNTLLLPGEVAVYWIEHGLLLSIPVFLLKFTDLTVPSKTWQDLVGWGLLSYGIWGLFHFLFLQPLASMSLANLNSMLCPAITDPFRGPDYRSYGIMHQFFITILCGCVVNYFGHRDHHGKRMID